MKVLQTDSFVLYRVDCIRGGHELFTGIDMSYMRIQSYLK